MKYIGITGANGFIGRAVASRLEADGDSFCRCFVRDNNENIIGRSEVVSVGDIETSAILKDSLFGLDILIHAAARVHILNGSTAGALDKYREVNVQGTLSLAHCAADMGVKRFVYISSIKVNGENTNGQFFAPDDAEKPLDPYGVSKFEAEQGLIKIAKETGMELVIIRPPLVYGPGVKSNFLSMIKWIEKGVPLPFGAIQNKRSLIAIDNLVDFIVTCVGHPYAANEIFLVSDGEDVSTTELIKKIAAAFGKKAILIPIPVGVLRFFAVLTGRVALAHRLLGSLQIDDSKARTLLGWMPIISMDQQLKKTVKAYKNEKGI